MLLPNSPLGMESVEASPTTVSLSKASVSYEAIWVANLTIYDTTVDVYGDIYSIYPYNSYLYGITTKGYLLKSTDIVHWEILGNILNSTLQTYVPHDYKGGIFITSNGTIIVNFCNSTAGVYFILRGTETTFPFEVVKTDIAWWSNAHIVETDQGTLVMTGYAGSAVTDVLAWRSTDKGKTWTLVLNATNDLWYPSGQNVTGRHSHYMYYDPLEDVIYIAGGERSATQPSSWIDRVTFYSNDDGITWNILGQIYQDGPVIAGEKGLFFGGHGLKYLSYYSKKLILFNGPPLIGKVIFPDVGGQQTGKFDYENDILYIGDYDSDEDYYDVYAVLEVNGTPMPFIKIATIYVTPKRQSQQLEFFKDYVIDVIGESRTFDYLLVYRKLTKEELLFFSSNIDYTMAQGTYSIPIYAYITNITMTFNKIDVYNNSITNPILFYDDFEDGDISDWTVEVGTASVATLGGSKVLNITQGRVKKTVVFSSNIPAGSQIAIAGRVIHTADLDKRYDSTGDMDIIHRYVTVGYVDGTTETFYPLGYESRQPQNIWTFLFFSTIPSLSKDTQNITVSWQVTINSLYIDDLVIFVVNSTIASKYDLLVYPSLQNGTTIYINGTQYNVESSVTLTPNKYVTTLNLTIPINFGLFNLSIQKEGGYANVPLLPVNNIYYYSLGYDENNILGYKSDKIIVISKTNNTVLSPPTFTDQRLHATIDAPSGTTSTIEIYCGSYGKPYSVYVDPPSELVSWSYNVSSSILTVQVKHGSPANLTVSWVAEYTGGSPGVSTYILLPSSKKIPPNSLVELRGRLIDDFGYSVPYAKLTVTFLWNGSQITVTTDSDGYFTVKFMTPSENGKYAIYIYYPGDSQRTPCEATYTFTVGLTPLTPQFTPPTLHLTWQQKLILIGCAILMYMWRRKKIE